MDKTIMMTRTPGGHCHVSVTDWTGKQPILISAAAAKEYGVSQDALQMKRGTPSAGTRVYQTAASAIQRAYYSWRKSATATASSAAIRNQ
eukprot:2191685-Amphidinium_carterae.1